MSRYVALLRGINVGTAKRIAMADLRELCSDLGFGEVATLLNSGNVVLSSAVKPASIATKLRGGIDERFGMDVEVVVRSAAQMRAVAKHDPFSSIADPLKYYSVHFLAEKLDPGWLPDADEFAPERFELHGLELYLWMPDGQIKSAMMKTMAATKLPVVATNRNWNTVLKLADMLEG